MSSKSHSQLNQLPYSGLPNTRPRVSSPLVSELTFQRHSDLVELIDHPLHKSNFATTTFLLVFFLIDSLTFVQLVKFALPKLHNQLLPLLPFTPAPAHELVQTITSIPSNLIISTVAMVKSISGVCLVKTGTTCMSYSMRNVVVYITLTGLLALPNPSAVLSFSILFVSLLAGSVVICLPLLRLTQILLDLEDQQLIDNRRRQIIHQRHHPLRKSLAPHQRNSGLLQARYQHLMNPFWSSSVCLYASICAHRCMSFEGCFDHRRITQQDCLISLHKLTPIMTSSVFSLVIRWVTYYLVN